MPDFFRGNPASLSWVPRDTPEEEKFWGFLKGPAAPPKTIAQIPGVVKEITEKTGSKITKWAILGVCWGGKVGPPSNLWKTCPNGFPQVATQSCQAGTPFSAAAKVHPAMVDPKDAPSVTVPM